jgi:site-specific DNA recombinase
MHSIPPPTFQPQAVQHACQVTEVMRKNVQSGETPFRRAYIRSVIDQAELDDTEIRIIERKSVLERPVMSGGAVSARVPSYIRKWRARHDSKG